MPGIVAIITKRPKVQVVPQLARMVESLCHEPSYTSGTWLDESAGVYMGWAARQGSCSDKTPLRNEQGNITLAFSGEEYPDPNTIRDLRSAGHEIVGNGPEYLVHMYEEDRSFPAGLNGRFHGLVVDRLRGETTIFNDRYGMHRLYWYQSQDAFYFAAEAKAILAVCPELREADPQALGEFISCGAVLENRTLFKSIGVLPHAAQWIFRNGTLVQKRAYFQPRDWEQQEPLELEPYYQKLRETFHRVLPRYFEGGEPIGMSLTGGLDTRMILACRKTTPGSLPCYTFGSMFNENQDVRVARHVAETCGQTHQVLTAGQDFLSKFSHYAERAVYLTDGCVDTSRAPDLYLNERAGEIAPIRMTGIYGGEILRGVRAFKPVNPPAGLFSGEFESLAHQVKQTCANILLSNQVSFAVFQQCPWLLYGVLALEQTQLTMRTPYLDNEFVQTVFRSPKPALATTEVSLRLVADGNQALARIATDRGVGGDRRGALGAASRRYQEFMFKAEYAYDMGMPQWLAQIDHAFSSLHFERMFLGRHKPFHFRIWYRDALAKYIQEILLDERALSRSYINRKALEAIVRGHVSGNKNFTNEIHKVLTLELIHRLFLDSETAVTHSTSSFEQEAFAG